MKIGLHHAQLSFGTTEALDHCDLELETGEQVALIGPSGSGKSSLLKVLATEYSLSSGSYRYDGEDVTSLTQAQLKSLRSNIAYIPQSLALVPNIRVNQNIQLGKVGQQSFLGTLSSLIAPNKQSLEEIHTVLSELGITEKMFHRTDSLSGGQQQRVAIARALYQDAALLLADEPVSAVDPSRAHDLLRQLTKLSSEKQITLICSVHNLEYAKRYFPRLIGMREGRVYFDGPPSSFSAEDFNALYQLDNA